MNAKSITAESAPVHQHDATETLRKMKSLAHVMDTAIRIPGTRRRIGLDSLVGLIPGVGDAASAAVSSLIVHQAFKLGARKRTLARMLRNIGVDMLVGAVPLVGDLFDFAFKANTKNVALLEEELRHRHEGSDAQ